MPRAAAAQRRDRRGRPSRDLQLDPPTATGTELNTAVARGGDQSTVCRRAPTGHSFMDAKTMPELGQVASCAVSATAGTH